MIKVINILKTLIEIIRKNFTNICIEAKEVKEGYRRKSLYIYLENTRVQNYMDQYRETNSNVRIIYHPQNDDDLEELLEIQEKLNEIFADKYCIEVDGVPVELKNVDTTISDGDLLFNFDVYLFEEYSQPDVEMMEELYLKEGLNGNN